MNATKMKTGMDDAAEKVKASAGSAYETAKEGARGVAADVKNKAAETVGAALDAAAARLDDKKDDLVEGADRLEGRLRDVAGDEDAGRLQSRVMGSMADGVSAVTDRLRDRSLQDLADEVKGFARRHPGAFVAGAALLGFAAARFLRASARNARIARSATAADMTGNWPNSGGRT